MKCNHSQKKSGTGPSYDDIDEILAIIREYAKMFAKKLREMLVEQKKDYFECTDAHQALLALLVSKGYVTYNEYHESLKKLKAFMREGMGPDPLAEIRLQSRGGENENAPKEPQEKR
jgi:hypothetical protein